MWMFRESHHAKSRASHSSDLAGWWSHTDTDAVNLRWKTCWTKTSLAKNTSVTLSTPYGCVFKLCKVEFKKISFSHSRRRNSLKMLQFVVVSQCLIEVGGLTQVYPAFVASHPSTEWLNIWIEAFFSCLFNLPLVKRCCAPAPASRSSKPLLVQEQVLFPDADFFSLLLWRFGSELCIPSREQNNSKLRVCVTVIWRKQRYPFLLPKSTEAFHTGCAVAMTLWRAAVQ